jgi:hypothetical protein
MTWGSAHAGAALPSEGLQLKGANERAGARSVHG